MTKKSFKKTDPNYQKELAKYGNPIPSRDYKARNKYGLVEVAINPSFSGAWLLVVHHF